MTHRFDPGDDVALTDWLTAKRERPFGVTRIPLAEVEHWGYVPENGSFEHRTGRFFTVGGIHVETDHGAVREWWQPILIQSDIAILGIIARTFGGVRHFLLQAKMEPGNTDVVQLSPTVQATSSNYTRVHRGPRAPYVEFFTEPERGRVLVDVLQCEQGAWFHQKRNRNVVVEVDGDVPEHDDFCWVTLEQVHRLLRRPDVINMDSRTVLACLSAVAAPAPGGERALHTPEEIQSWFTGRKAAYRMRVRPAPVTALPGWRADGARIAPENGGGFDIVGVRVHAQTREVTAWCQPLLAPRGVGLAALLVRDIGGVRHVLVHAEVQPGHRDTVEMGPTVRWTPGAGDPEPDFLEHVRPERATLHYDVVQSEEGGRFLHGRTRYVVAEVGDDFPVAVPDDYLWITPRQLADLQRHSYYVTIENRSLLFLLSRSPLTENDS
ncbi:NDP-hexose 2,3-dehydratase family protein [Actinomadura flavalba]|uniref:NDP-hexose 2,3-dehydratase family protein n=1 Tax=Actinomadura flavalba TaxID=1120938 RepID=UPI00035E3EE6|nr:NDP-hexose 2,3-dehydratase family protein [Actinomadura flavalba]